MKLTKRRDRKAGGVYRSWEAEGGKGKVLLSEHSLRKRCSLAVNLQASTARAGREVTSHMSH